MFRQIKGLIFKRYNRRAERKAPLYWRSRTFLDWAILSGKVFGVLVVTFVVCHFLFLSDYFRLKEVHLVGELNSMKREDLLKIANPPYGGNIFLMNLFQISENIRRNPWIRHVQIRRHFPDRLLVHVEENKAIAVLQVDKFFYLMNEQGELFKKSTKNYGLPSINGFSEKQLKTTPQFSRVQLHNIFDLLSRFDQTDWRILSAHVHQSEGVVLTITPIGVDQEWALNFGDGFFEKKIEKWNQFCSVHLKDMLLSEKKRIEVDLHVSGKIFSRL